MDRKIKIELECLFNKEKFEEILKKAERELATLGIVEDIRNTKPYITLLIGLMRGKPKDKVSIKISDNNE